MLNTDRRSPNDEKRPVEQSTTRNLITIVSVTCLFPTRRLDLMDLTLDTRSMVQPASCISDRRCESRVGQQEYPNRPTSDFFVLSSVSTHSLHGYLPKVIDKKHRGPLKNVSRGAFSGRPLGLRAPPNDPDLSHPPNSPFSGHDHEVHQTERPGFAGLHRMSKTTPQV